MFLRACCGAATGVHAAVLQFRARSCAATGVHAAVPKIRAGVHAAVPKNAAAVRLLACSQMFSVVQRSRYLIPIFAHWFHVLFPGFRYEKCKANLSIICLTPYRANSRGFWLVCL